MIHDSFSCVQSTICVGVTSRCTDNTEGAMDTGDHIYNSKSGEEVRHGQNTLNNFDC